MIAGFEPAKLLQFCKLRRGVEPLPLTTWIYHRTVLPKSILSTQSQSPGYYCSFVNYMDFRAPLYIIILPLGYLLYLLISWVKAPLNCPVVHQTQLPVAGHPVTFIPAPYYKPLHSLIIIWTLPILVQPGLVVSPTQSPPLFYIYLHCLLSTYRQCVIPTSYGDQH